MPDQNPPPHDGTPNPPDLSVAFNWEDWAHYLGDMDGTDTQKKELIETLWTIILIFRDLGWEIKDEVDNSDETFDLAAALKAVVVDSKEHKQKEEA